MVRVLLRALLVKRKKRKETLTCNESFYSGLVGRVHGTLRLLGNRPRLASTVLDLVDDPLRHDAESAGIGSQILSFRFEMLLQVLGCELENVECKSEEGNEVEQNTDGSEHLAGVVFWVVLVFEHGGGLCRHQRHEEGRQFESVKDLEIFAVGLHQNLRQNGKRKEVRNACDRQHVVVKVCAKHEEGDGGFSRNDGDLPVPTAVQLVGAIEESRCLERPALFVRQLTYWNLEEYDEEKEESAVQGTHKREDQGIEQLRVVTFVAFEACVDGPVLRHHVFCEIQRVVYIDAEEDAQCCLQHRYEREVPDDHKRQRTSLRQVTLRSVASELRRVYRPEHDPEQKYGGGKDTQVDDERQRR